MEQLNNIDNNLKKVPHVRQVSLHMEAIKVLVCQRLEWTAERFNEFQLEAGFEFLNVLLEPLKGTKSKDEKLLTYSPLFWAWWRNEWYRRDRSIYKWSKLDQTDYEYLHTNDVITCPDTLKRFWGHAPEMLKAGEQALTKEVAA